MWALSDDGIRLPMTFGADLSAQGSGMSALAPLPLPRNSPWPAQSGAARQAELDWLRGLMLLLMTVTHLPTWFSAHVGQPFGYVSAAEGFVFLSAYLVGAVYTRTALKDGVAAMRAAVWRRAAQVYATHVALLLGLFFLLVPLALHYDAKPLTNLASFYIAQPKTATVAGLLLAYNPPLLDILPMYVIFLVLSPWLLARGLRGGWGSLLAASGMLWLLAQAGAGRELYQWLAGVVGSPLPYRETGAFGWLAWQLLWIAGLRMGAYTTQGPASASLSKTRPRYVLWSALAIAATCFAWRHAAGQVPFPSATELNAFFDKWQLGPLRLLNFAALAVIAVYGRRWLAAQAQRSPIATLGRASLSVFAAHLVVCLTLLATGIGRPDAARFEFMDAALLSGTLALLYGVALLAARQHRHSHGLRARTAARRRPPLDFSERAVQ